MEHKDQHRIRTELLHGDKEVTLEANTGERPFCIQPNLTLQNTEIPREVTFKSNLLTLLLIKTLFHPDLLNTVTGQVHLFPFSINGECMVAYHKIQLTKIIGQIYSFLGKFAPDFEGVKKICVDYPYEIESELLRISGLEDSKQPERNFIVVPASILHTLAAKFHGQDIIKCFSKFWPQYPDLRKPENRTWILGLEKPITLRGVLGAYTKFGTLRNLKTRDGQLLKNNGKNPSLELIFSVQLCDKQLLRYNQLYEFFSPNPFPDSIDSSRGSFHQHGMFHKLENEVRTLGKCLQMGSFIEPPPSKSSNINSKPDTMRQLRRRIVKSVESGTEPDYAPSRPIKRLKS